MAKVAQRASAFGTQLNPHFWGTGISLAATLHVAATFPRNPHNVASGPYLNESVTEMDSTPHPIRENLTDPIFTQTDSYLDVPTTPGLGVEVDEDVIKKFLVGGEQGVQWHA